MPIASASLPWQIVLAIIAFNIVVGIMNKRKQQPKPGSPDAARKQEEARLKVEAAHAKAKAQAEREAAERQAREARDEKASEAATAAQAKKDKALDVGKDILGQLAKELGLELPEAKKPAPPKPAPAPASAPSRPAPTPARPARPGRAEFERERPSTLKDLLAAQKSASANAGENAPRRMRPSATGPEPARAPAAVPLAAQIDLADADALRRAIVLKTILDKPLALQPRRR